ncbi:MAG: hypothetical protein ACI82O_004037 [Patiriisocius sp.]|jgi:hypothetical protein
MKMGGSMPVSSRVVMNLPLSVRLELFASDFPRVRIEHNLNNANLRNPLANWMMHSGELIAPLITQLDSEIRRGKVIQCDERPLQVLHEPDRPASSQSYM